MSQVRIKSEGKIALSTDGTLALLHLTEEGRHILQRFSATVGCDYNLMTDDTMKAILLENHYAELCCFIRGMLLFD